jgi:hypothetical protein
MTPLEPGNSYAGTGQDSQISTRAVSQPAFISCDLNQSEGVRMAVVALLRGLFELDR